MSSPAPDPHHWRLVGVLALTQTIGYGALIQSFTVLLVPISRDLDVPRTAVTLAATISTLVGAVVAVPIGRALDRHGGRVMMAGGSVVGVGAVVLWSQSQDLVMLYGAFALIGLALAMSTYEAAFAVIVATVETRRRDGAIVVVTMITGLVTSLYYPLAGLLEASIGWRATLLVLAGSLAVVAVPAHLWALPGRAAHARRVAKRGGVPIGDALRSVPFWLLTLSFVAQASATSAFLMLMVPYFRDAGHPAVVAAALPTAIGILQITSRLGLAPLARRFGMAQVTAVSFAVQGLGLLTLPLVGTNVPLTIACTAAFGLGYGISVVARPSIIADTFGVARFGSILASMTVPMALARAGAPLLAAWLADGRFLVVFGVAALASAAALVPVFRTAAPATPGATTFDTAPTDDAHTVDTGTR